MTTIGILFAFALLMRSLRVAPGEIDLTETLAEQRRQQQEDRGLGFMRWCTRWVLIPRDQDFIRFDDNKIPYLRRIYQLVEDRVTHTGQGAHVEEFWLVAGSQVGKTSWVYGFLCWILGCFPRDMGFVMSRLESLKRTNKLKLQPMIKKCERLKVQLPRSAEGLRQALGARMWQMAATINFLCGSVANDLRMLPLGILVFDEFDNLPANCEGEGDPIKLGQDRQKDFPHDKMTLGSTTPTTITAHGWRRLCAGTNERLHIACPGCGAHVWLDPDRLIAPTDATADEIVMNDLATWVCPYCDVAHTSDQKDRAVIAACESLEFTDAGGWVPGTWAVTPEFPLGIWTPLAVRNPDDRKLYMVPPLVGLRVSQWLNSLYARSITYGAFLANELNAKEGTPEEWQAHVNGWRAEPYMFTMGAINDRDVALTEDTDPAYILGSCPYECRALILVVDQQGNDSATLWLPYSIRAWHCIDGVVSSSLIEAGEIRRGAGSWKAIEELELRGFSVGGKMIRSGLTVVDAGNGNMDADVLAFCALKPKRRIATKGDGRMDKSVPWMDVKPKAGGDRRVFCRFIRLNTNHWKNKLYDQLTRQDGALIWRRPKSVPDWYTSSLTSEERIEQEVDYGGRKIKTLVWRPRMLVNTRGHAAARTDTHWWDCEYVHQAIADVFGLNRAAPLPGTGSASGNIYGS